jgi:hydrogenase maturation protease
MLEGRSGKNPASKFQHPVSKTLVLGLGNPILTDDGVGIHIVRAAASRCSQVDSLVFAEASVGGLRLLDLLMGYDQVILIDAIQTCDGKPGDIYWLGPDDLQTSLHSSSTHDLSLCGVLALGRALGLRLPRDEAIVLIAVEVDDILAFGQVCTPAVTSAIPFAVEAVLTELRKCRQ